jgi:hypothetical protein
MCAQESISSANYNLLCQCRAVLGNNHGTGRNCTMHMRAGRVSLMMAGRMFIGAPVFTDQDFVPLVALWWPRLGWPENIGWNHCQPGLTKPPPAGFHGSKKTGR